MNKIYKCFISSTFRDLEEERRRVIEAVLDFHQLPVGMENFSAADESQWEYITRMLEDCDYFIVIVAHNYGTTDESGMSYTEKETRYALDKGIPVLAFVLSSSVKDWPHDRYDKNPGNEDRLVQFKEFLTTDRMVKYWTDKNDLAAKVGAALSDAIKYYPRPGYVRGIPGTVQLLGYETIRAPKFDITFDGKSELAIDLSQFKCVEKAPILPLEREVSHCQPEKLRVSDRAVDEWNMAVPGYNAEIDEYNAKAEKYNRLRTALPIEFIVSNTGTQRAHNLLMIIEFPDWITCYDSKYLPEKPRVPKIPDNPVEAAMIRLKKQANPFATISALGQFATMCATPVCPEINLSRYASLPSLKKPHRYLSITSDNTAEFHVDTIQHGSSEKCSKLRILPAEMSPMSGTIRIICHCDELPEPQIIEMPVCIT